MPKHFLTKNFIYTLLLPLSYLYRVVVFLRNLFAPKKYVSKAKLICVGNVVVGGSGKTPTAISIAEFLQAHKMRVAFITRGYKGKYKDVWVEKKHTAYDVGDEPLILSLVAPTYVCSSRLKAVKKIENKFDAIIFDDALHYTQLKMDFTLMVFDGKIGVGNNALLPAGPLRESLVSGIAKSNAVVIVGEDKTKIISKIAASKLPIFKANITPEKIKLKTKKIVAFAGIGRPEKFFETLNNMGYEIVKKYEFADHHFFSDSEINDILHFATKNKCVVMTTQKDFVRLAKKWQTKINYIKINMDIEDNFYQKLKGVICKKR